MLCVIKLFVVILSVMAPWSMGMLGKALPGHNSSEFLHSCDSNFTIDSSSEVKSLNLVMPEQKIKCLDILITFKIMLSVVKLCAVVLSVVASIN
jgi:hypothetical protein